MSIVVSFVLSLHPSNFSIQAGFLKEAKGLQRGNKNPAGPDDLTHILREEKVNLWPGGSHSGARR